MSWSKPDSFLIWIKLTYWGAFMILESSARKYWRLDLVEETNSRATKMTRLIARLDNIRPRWTMNVGCAQATKSATRAGTDSGPKPEVRSNELPPSASEALQNMLAFHGLDTDRNPLQSALRFDLYSVCVNCAQRQGCYQWLAGRKNDFGYRVICPNAPIFDRFISRDRWRGLRPLIETSSSS